MVNWEAAFALLAGMYFGLIGFIVWRQSELIRQMSQLLASRSLGEWANAQKRLSSSPKEREEPKENW